MTLDLAQLGRRVFQNATTQKKRSARLRVVTLVERHRDCGRFGDDDRVYYRLLDLSGEKQRYRAVVVLIIGVVMDEFMHAWTDREHCSPLKHRSQEQSNNCGARGGIGDLSGYRLSGFPFSNHENTWGPGQCKQAELKFRVPKIYCK